MKQYPKGLSTVTLLAEEPQTGYHFAQVTFKAEEVLPRGKGNQGTCYVLAWALRWLGFNFDPLRIRGPKNREVKSGRGFSTLLSHRYGHALSPFFGPLLEPKQ